MEKQGAEEPLFNRTSGQGTDDSFYETIDRSPEYDNNLNTKQMSAEDQAKQQEEWRKELLKLEEEIHTLQTVLSAKIRCAGELKRKLGVTPYVEFKQDVQSGIKTIKDSDAYKKTNEQLSYMQKSVTTSPAYQYTNEKLTHLNDSIHESHAYQKTSDAFKAFGAFTTKKIGDARNSNAFKSFEERIGGAYSSVKTKMSGSRSENSFQELKNENQTAASEEDSTKDEGSAASTPSTEQAVEPGSK